MALFGRKKEEKKVTPKTEASAKAPGASGSVASVAVASIKGGDTYVLIRPRITEKATIVTESGAYVFEVATRATKQQIKEAVSRFYKVTPVKVNVVTIPKKKIRSKARGRFGTTPGGKKAYVYLKEGDTIELV